jgi:hypothetical protein
MISTAAVQLLHEYTGRGPTKAKTLINDELSQNHIDPDLAVEVFVLQADGADQQEPEARIES